MNSDRIDHGRRQGPSTYGAGVTAPQPVLGRPSIPGAERHGRARRVRRIAGFVGVAAALPFFIWLPLGWLEAVPSMVETFGVVGLRTPAGITVGGLLLAAIGFYDA